MMDTARASGVLLVTSFLLAGCWSSPGSGQPPSDALAPVATTQGTPAAPEATSPPEAPPSTPASSLRDASPLPVMEQAAVASPQTPPAASALSGEPAAPKISVTPSTDRASTPAPHQEPTSPALEHAPAPVVAKGPIAVDIGGPVEVGATKPGLTRVGAEKCKLCHKVQFTSWAKTTHATRTPPLDCESCHGPGSEYKSLAIMKDPQKARSAGLVIPIRAFCSKCHKSGWTDDLLKRTHAHKAGA